MRPPVSPLSTTTTRRTSCTLATSIPPNYEPGSRFRVLAPDGSEVDVTVPAGAEAGDMIQVPLTVTDQPNWAPTGGVKYTQARPSGKWSSSLFNVTDHLGICCLSCCFCTAPILFGQIYEKQPYEDKENFPLGRCAFCRCERCDYKRETRKGTCFTIIGLFVVYLFFAIVSLVFQDRGICKYALDSWKTCVAFYFLWWIVWLIFFLSFFVFALFLRMAIRRKYGIKEECCTCTGVDGFEDACCACWCGCCATAQMARHEFLEVETGIVRYDCCSATGE